MHLQSEVGDWLLIPRPDRTIAKAIKKTDQPIPPNNNFPQTNMEAPKPQYFFGSLGSIYRGLLGASMLA